MSNIFGTFYGTSGQGGNTSNRPRQRNPQVGGGKPSFGSAKRGGGMFNCKCDDGADLNVYASNIRQANRRCERRGNAVGSDCGFWLGSGGGLSFVR